MFDFPTWRLSKEAFAFATLSNSLLLTQCNIAMSITFNVVLL